MASGINRATIACSACMVGGISFACSDLNVEGVDCGGCCMLGRQLTFGCRYEEPKPLKFDAYLSHAWGSDETFINQCVTAQASLSWVSRRSSCHAIAFRACFATYREVLVPFRSRFPLAFHEVLVPFRSRFPLASLEVLVFFPCHTRIFYSFSQL
jgi:hypothetical protein